MPPSRKCPKISLWNFKTWKSPMYCVSLLRSIWYGLENVTAVKISLILGVVELNWSFSLPPYSFPTHIPQTRTFLWEWVCPTKLLEKITCTRGSILANTVYIHFILLKKKVPSTTSLTMFSAASIQFCVCFTRFSLEPAPDKGSSHCQPVQYVIPIVPNLFQGPSLHTLSWDV